MLNLEQFESPEAAKAAVLVQGVFEHELRSALSGTTNLTLLTMFVMSIGVRARGLYDAIAREISKDNPYAVFPLMRQFAETVAVAFYTADHPSYVEALKTAEREKPPGAPRRKSVRALVSYMERVHAEQFGLVYDELSEVTHFGSLALWIAHRAHGDRRVSWTSVPSWKAESQLYVACAQLLELREAMVAAIEALGEALVTDTLPDFGATAPA
jgi:hypothetical protein